MCTTTRILSIYLFLCGSLVLCSHESVVDLYADEKLSLQTILPGDTKIYFLHNLAPNSQYETPANFKLEIMEPIDQHNSRQLLNIEKLMFATDWQGYIVDRAPPEKGYYRVQVTVEPTGVLPDKSIDPSPFQFNIVLETLLMGAPYDVIVIGLFVAVMSVLMATILVPQLFPRLPGFKTLVD